MIDPGIEGITWTNTNNVNVPPCRNQREQWCFCILKWNLPIWRDTGIGGRHQISDIHTNEVLGLFIYLTWFQAMKTPWNFCESPMLFFRYLRGPENAVQILELMRDPITLDLCDRGFRQKNCQVVTQSPTRGGILALETRSLWSLLIRRKPYQLSPNKGGLWFDKQEG